MEDSKKSFRIFQLFQYTCQCDQNGVCGRPNSVTLQQRLNSVVTELQSLEVSSRVAELIWEGVCIKTSLNKTNFLVSKCSAPLRIAKIWNFRPFKELRSSDLHILDSITVWSHCFQYSVERSSSLVMACKGCGRVATC